MKLIFMLIKNEYIKLFKRKSVPILLLILVLFVFGISLIKPYDFVSYREYYDYYDTYYFNQRQQEFNDAKANPYYNMSMPEERNITVEAVLKEFYEKQITLCDKAKAVRDEDPSDWRIPAIVELLNLFPTDYLIDYISEGGTHADEVQNFLNSIQYYYFNADNYVSYSAQLKAIEENDYSESKRYLYNRAVKIEENYKKQLSELENKKAKGTGGSNIDFDIYKAKGMVTNSERLTRTYQAALDKKITYNSVQDVMLKHTVNSFDSAINGYKSMYSKEEYEKSFNGDVSNKGDIIYSSNYYYDYSGINTYEEYLEGKKEDIESDENKGLIGLYALENDVIEMSVANSSRFKSLSYVNLFWLIAPLAIFFASGMVSKEFSSKTINLLLIRPVKRWKILLSKYVCLISLTFGMVAVCGAVYLLGTGIRYGFSDFLQPYIYVSSGAATSVSFTGWFLWKVLIASIPVFCLVNITFLFSSVTKGTAVSLILGVLSLFSSILILFFTDLIKNPDVLTYLPFPYFSMWSYMFDNVIVLDGSTINIFGKIIKTNLTYGAILLVGLIIASVIWAFADFTKKDIK